MKASGIQLPTHTLQELSANPPTQTVGLVLGFTPREIQRAEAEPKLTVEELLQIESYQDHVKTPLKMLVSIYVYQTKRFLPLAQEAKKLVETLKMEQDAAQWAGIPPEKLLQESFVEQLNSI